LLFLWGRRPCGWLRHSRASLDQGPCGFALGAREVIAAAVFLPIFNFRSGRGRPTFGARRVDLRPYPQVGARATVMPTADIRRNDASEQRRCVAGQGASRR
jgi:hypothetical protein